MMGFPYPLENNFTYHKPLGDQPERYVKIRDKAKELAALILETCPDSRESSVATDGIGDRHLLGQRQYRPERKRAAAGGPDQPALKKGEAFVVPAHRPPGRQPRRAVRLSGPQPSRPSRCLRRPVGPGRDGRQQVPDGHLGVRGEAAPGRQLRPGPGRAGPGRRQAGQAGLAQQGGGQGPVAAGPAAAPACPGSFRLVNIEARGVLLVKRTAALPLPASLLEVHEATGKVKYAQQGAPLFLLGENPGVLSFSSPQ